MTTSTLLRPTNVRPRGDGSESTLRKPATPPSHPSFSPANERRENATSALGVVRRASTTAVGQQRLAGRPSGPQDVRVSGLSTWTGRVVDIDEELFTAELAPGPNTPGAKVLADFDRSLVVAESEDLRVGDVVYVTIRRVRAPHGLVNETSSIRLRRIGKWTDSDVQAHVKRADELFAEFSAHIVRE